MVCLFCSSKNHQTVYCNIYVSDKGRIEKLRQKNICGSCLKPNHSSIKDKILCELNQKCYICFIQARHPSFLCPERTKKQKLFVPDIDQSLIPRFLQMLNPIEQFSLGFSTSQALQPSILKELIVKSVAHNFNVSIFPSSNILINDEFVYHGDCDISNITFIANRIRLCSMTLQLRQFLKTASNKTKILQLDGVTMEPAIQFPEILQHFPNLTCLQIASTNIEMGTTWPEALLQYKNLKNLHEIKIEVNGFTFDIEDLAKVLKASKKLQFTLIDNEKPTQKVKKSILKAFAACPNTYPNATSHSVLHVCYSIDDGVFIQWGCYRPM